ncbi:mannose-ethanolamine phosphotransferase gpi13 [Coemansia biformis]|uniref:Mannose-ethanolamine phosphotransferase gpi13 n=1 Tax=Coemansia biformis TaxID=1286918 RepID=A0A9W7YEJ3_9FUNG|nr:mannose-ethanolamine phosphotransferase gpi13 [Coemansia biformis]
MDSAASTSELSAPVGGSRNGPKAALAVRGHWALSAMLVAVGAAGLWLFSRGFLLTRMVLPDRSDPSVLPFAGLPAEAVGAASAPCEWYPAKFQRAVVLVVDAMRVDFATWSGELNATFGAGEGQPTGRPPGRLMPYHNRLPAIAALSAARPEQAMFYRFRADPPTTTLQRLKGLTTGQLPTFIDAGSNFAGSAIDEDNWLRALVTPGCGAGRPGRAARGRNIVFLGDDTWTSLFPGELADTRAAEDSGAQRDTPAAAGWARVRPFPSLNVWDLDTVDDGVFSRLPLFLLPPESADQGMGAAQASELRERRQRWRQLVRQPHMWAHADFGNATAAGGMASSRVSAEQLHREWDVIIAHGLGVDHCGHRFGPDHPAISSKLAQMNQAIELIVDAIDRDDTPTALFVFGDHGMDPKGDHGGDSPREVDAGLWIYANTRWHSRDGDGRAARVLEAARELLADTQLGASLDSDLKDAWWRNTHLSDDYRALSGSGLPPAAPTHRSIPQIDLVSTLALALGLPIPFNNLGAVVPEMFAADDGPGAEWGLLRALRLNAAQTLRYIDTYVDRSRSHGFADDALRAWRAAYSRAEASYRELGALTTEGAKARRQQHTRALEERAAAEYFAFLRLVLGSLRQMWAQFDAVLIAAGLGTLALVAAALAMLYLRTRHSTLESIAAGACGMALGSGVAGAVAFRALGTLLVSTGVSHLTPLEATVAGLAVGTAAALVAALASGSQGQPSTRSVRDCIWRTLASPVARLNAVAVVAAVVHALAFLSNSFTFNEDSVVLYAAQTLVLAVAATAAAAALSPAHATQQRSGAVCAVACSAALLVLNRLSSYSTVCREEQLPGCTPTFYGLPSASISTLPLAAANVLMVWLVPYAVSRALRRSHSDKAMVAGLWVNIGMRVSMGMAAAYWVLDALDGQLASRAASGAGPATAAPGSPAAAAAAGGGSDWSELRIVLARMAAGVAVGGGLAAWYASPFCLDIAVAPALPQPAASPAKRGAASATPAPRQTAVILGYGNAFGAAYLVFATVVFCVLYLVQQPMGAIMLSGLLVKIILWAELFDALRDALADTADGALLPAQVTLLALLSFLDYFSTGHQFTLVSIQWNTAFVGMRDMQLVVCGAIVALNTLGSFILAAVCVPLALVWNEPLGSPRLRLAPDSYFARITGAAAAYIAYHALIATSTAAWAAWFRRHLMVWKIFAPRLMFSIPVLLVSAAAVLFAAVGLAAVHILRLGLHVGSARSLVGQAIQTR